MHTRSQTRNLHNQQHQAPPPVVEPFNLEEPFENPPPPPPPMDDQRTMAQLLEAPTAGYEDAIVVPEITADNFELKHGLLNLVQNKQFFGHDKEDPHAHIRYFNKITSTRSSRTPITSRFYSLTMKKINLPLLLLSKRLRKVVLLAVVLIPTKLVQPLRAMFIEIISKNMSLKQPQQLHQKKPVSAPISNQIRPPGFPPVQNNHVQNQGNNQNRYNQNRGNFNQAPAYQPPVHQGQIYRPQVVQPPAYQAPAYQAPAPQIQGVSKEDFQAYVNQLTNLTDMLSKFVTSNTVSTSGTLPSNTVTNPKEDLKGITTRSGVAYKGPTIHTTSSPKVVEREPEVTKDTMHPTNNGSTEDVPPPVVPVVHHESISEPVNAPVSASRPNQKASIPFPSRRNDERRREKANDQIEKFYEIFRDLSFEIAYDGLMLSQNRSSKSLPKKLGDPGRFLIPCEFSGINTCNALADLGTSINLMPYSVWKTLSLPELTPTCMTLELADRSSRLNQVGIAEESYVTMGKVPISLQILEAITFNLDQTSRYTANYNHMTANRIDVIDMACEEYSQEVLGFSNVVSSGNPTPYYDPIVSTSSPTLTPFGDRTSFSSKAILNSEPLPPLQGNYFPDTRKDLKIYEANHEKSSVNEPPEVELKDLQPHLEYAFLEVPQDRAIAWKLSDDKGINPEFCTHKNLIRRGLRNQTVRIKGGKPKIQDVIRKQFEKLLTAGLIYPISDSPWVSPVHCVPKKGGMTVVKNDENDLIPTRLVTGWRVCIDYRKLNEATRKDHFPLPFMDQMLERLAGNQFYCFLDGFSGYFQIPIDPKDQEKTTFTCPYGTFAYRRMPFGLCNAPGTFQRCMMAIFHDMIEKTMEVFMDDFSVFGDSFSTCLSHLDKMLKRCEDTNLVLNWEKSHFMVKEGIVLGHKISKSGIEVDRAKVDVIAKLPHPTTVKGVRSFTLGMQYYTTNHTRLRQK
ncbi:reverse transcriptase domain-containing protein [Tanacetum coccineum]